MRWVVSINTFVAFSENINFKDVLATNHLLGNLPMQLETVLNFL